jgi:hypothetical protein
MEKSGTSAAIVSAVVALLVGGGVGYVVGNNNDEDMNKTANNSESAESGTSEANSVQAPAASLRVALNNALQEHVNLAGVTLRNVYLEAPDTDAAVAALDENSKEVAGLVGSVYGDDAEASFLELWRNHITFFANYTVAARDDDQAGIDQAKEDLAGYGEAASNFFESANPNLPKDAVMPLLEEHRNLVLTVIDTLDAGDLEGTYVALTAAADQSKDIADALAGGIEAQFPEMY